MFYLAMTNTRRAVKLDSRSTRPAAGPINKGGTYQRGAEPYQPGLVVPTPFPSAVEFMTSGHETLRPREHCRRRQCPETVVECSRYSTPLVASLQVSSFGCTEAVGLGQRMAASQQLSTMTAGMCSWGRGAVGDAVGECSWQATVSPLRCAEGRNNSTVSPLTI